MRHVLATFRTPDPKSKRDAFDISVYKPQQLTRPNGLVVGYLLWVQGIPGSNPGWAPPFFYRQERILTNPTEFEQTNRRVLYTSKRHNLP